MQPWSAAQRSRMEALVAHTYDAFRSRVEAGRGLTRERLDDLAGGRVWTGAQALEHGLVDKLGDLQSAFEEAGRLAGLPAGPDLRIQRIKGGRRLLATPAEAAAAGPAAAEPAAVLLLRALAAIGGPSQAGQLTTPQFAAESATWSELLARESIWLLSDTLPGL
jgi:protease-4